MYGITGRRHSDIGSGRPPIAAADNTSSSSSSSYSSSSLLLQVQVDSNIPCPDQQQQKTAIDEEREMFLLKRRMSAAYSKGHYRSALSFAEQLEEKASTLLGVKNAVYASCLNNTALMVGEQRRLLINDDDDMLLLLLLILSDRASTPLLYFVSAQDAGPEGIIYEQVRGGTACV